MIQHARLTPAAGTHELIAAIERSQILLTRPLPAPLFAITTNWTSPCLSGSCRTRAVFANSTG